jgi:hypothetical protein
MDAESQLKPLFDPIYARFQGQADTILHLLAENHALEDQLYAIREADPTRFGGWTGIPSIQIGSGARTVHVSSSAGTAANDGLSPDTPVDTLARGVALLRDGFSDRLLLRRGDVFRESFGAWTKSGRSPDQPLIISAYGDGPRPRVVSPGSALSVLSGEVHDLMIVGLHLAAAGRDPSQPDFDPASPAGHGVRVIRPVTNLLIEDCRVEFFSTNLTLTAGDDAAARLTDVRVRRCQVLDAWSTAGAFSGQGLYASGCDGLLIEDNLFDHNGWNEQVPGAAPNIFRHNIYLSAANTSVNVRGNIIANASSHGLQLRGGGVVEDNLFVDNAIHCLVAGSVGRFRRNALLGGRDIDADNPRGFGLTLACADGRAECNVVANKSPAPGAAFTVQRNDWTPPGPMRAAFVGNVVFSWAGNGLDVTGDCDLLEFVGNDLQCIAPGRKLLNVKAKVGRYQLAANRYFPLEDKPQRWFWLTDAFLPPDRWSAATGATSLPRHVFYRDPVVPLPDNFLAAARAQTRQTWNPALMGEAIARSLRRALESIGDKTPAT